MTWRRHSCLPRRHSCRRSERIARFCWIFCRLLAAALLIWPLSAHDVISTKLLWTQEISRIVYRHCANCHREGGPAMSLTTYQDARPWAKAIRDEVISRRMPPWGAVKGVGEFQNDPSLSQIEIDMIVNWVEGGAPEGDPAFLPPLPNFPQPDDRRNRPSYHELAAPCTLKTAITLAGIRPQNLPAGAWMEIVATRPDGQVDRLIWLRGWRPQFAQTYHFRHPLPLPKSTRIAVYSNEPAKATLLIGR